MVLEKLSTTQSTNCQASVVARMQKFWRESKCDVRNTKVENKKKQLAGTCEFGRKVMLNSTKQIKKGGRLLEFYNNNKLVITEEKQMKFWREKDYERTDFGGSAYGVLYCSTVFLFRPISCGLSVC